METRHQAILIGGLLGLSALIGAAGLSLSVAAQPDRIALKAKFQRPAEIPFPKDDPYSAAKAELGRMLFFDPVMSGAKTHACATCHNPALSWGDGLPRAVGVKTLALRAPTLLNVAWTPKLGWDGHFRNLETVAFGPLTTPANMNITESQLIERLSAIPGYVDAFDEAFGEGDISKQKIEMALATFERTIISGEAPFDRWLKGDENAIGAKAKHGFDLFVGKANCAACHSGWVFTDASFHDIGTAKGNDIGRGKLFPTSVELRYAFKTPTLRDVARRSPYMHDGSVPTLQAVIDLYNKGGIARPSRAKEIKPLDLSEDEKADLIAFLEALTSAPSSVVMPTLPR